MEFISFYLNCVFRFFFTEYFHVYSNEKLWKENCMSLSRLSISVNGTAILEVFKPFESSLMVSSYQSQNPVDYHFTLFLGVSLSFCLPAITSVQTLYLTSGLVHWLHWQSFLLHPDPASQMSCLGEVLWLHCSLHRSPLWFSSVSWISAGRLSLAFPTWSHSVLPYTNFVLELCSPENIF